MSDEKRTYTYKRYMRDGTVQERTGVIRSKCKAFKAPK